LLKKIGDVEISVGLEKDQLIKKIADADAILVRSKTKVTRDVINAAKKLRVIGRAGVGVDNIDLDAATKRGIVVVNAIGLMLALARNILHASNSLKSRKWEKKKFMGLELRNKKLGIIGFGRIGSQVALRAKAFGMEILVYDPYISRELADNLGVRLVNLGELVEKSDFITIHLPLTEKTRGMIDRKIIGRMKKGAFLINCARGGIVDEKALYDALKSGKLGGAALDVFAAEPPLDSPLLKLDNIIVTPHLGASTYEAQSSASTIACEEVIKALQNRAPKNVVNMPAFPQEVLDELKNYIPLAENLGRLSVQLTKGRINDVYLTYCGALLEFENLNILTNSALSGLLSPILSEKVNILNAAIAAESRGIRVTERKKDSSGKFGNAIVLGIKIDEGRVEVEGALLGGEEPRIISIEGYAIDLIPSGRILLVKHEDKPGIIGKVALSLGERRINIGSMQVGRKKVGGMQLMVLRVDHKVSDEVLESIGKIDGVKKALAVEL
ncbi:MAG: phosphoglycerate dehydrogenase, partial [Candidatus Hydrothermarchaeaceae archaeon]